MSLFPSNPDDLDPKELKRIEDILHDAEEDPDALTDWEQGFCDDMRERVEQYGKRTRISDKQMEILDRIETKLYG